MELRENVVVAGKFRLLCMIGRGGMGSVWQATHLALDIPCAVKFIEGDFANLPEMQARFQREAKAAAALRSPHVVQILDHDIWEGMPYIAMELLDGEELSKRITAQGAISPAETNAILGQVCRALGRAHQQGIIHRDLKPDNLFLVRDDDREIVKVLDFGIAKSKNPNLDIGGNTKTGAMLGTPYYMSPEQAQGNKSIDGRSDLWALGVIAFECLTGRRPFESDALGDLLMQIMVKPLPVPSQVRPGVPTTFDAWFFKACARDPNERFQTAKELAEALATAVGQAAVTEMMSSAEKRALMMQGTLPVNTPNPMAGAASASTPNPYGPTVHPPPSMPNTGPAAPTPFATSIEGPPTKSLLPIFAALGGLVVLVVIGVVAFTLHARGSDNHAATPPATATATETTAATATETAAPTVAATATPTATATVTATATATPTATATHHVATSTTAKPHGTATAAHTATAAAGGGRPDLGF
ncbi:MAG TPA: serine/threonine-protein kinase [Polyangiaceae bacterium]|jgi:serine/threonine-protein kinase